MKTKVVQHVPRTNIIMSQTQSQSQTQTKTHWFPAFVMLTFFILSEIYLTRLTLIEANLRKKILSEEDFR